ncbi:glycosyl hydrolase 115 family protein [Halosquirtibacter xylanolyticus]|uniref:glycosyl hydrolase 115 family protein n=1 Tax=Halosquirtibacter xylanolyticus TaxID=3374599 RepID=UPI0037499D53|nr:glycosyl hydrolase 115 family protein [Prolixibacteraceae bacterium]
MKTKHRWSMLCVLIIMLICKSNGYTKEYILNKNINIYVDKNSDKLIKWAVKDIAKDIEYILEQKVLIHYDNTHFSDINGIYIGQINDTLIQNTFTKKKKLSNNHWEKYSIQLQQKNLFIVGSDIRGTVYGLFEFAQRIGISPWKWWADIDLQKKKEIHLQIPHHGIISSPSVQFRGIFLNDEDWGLQPWAAKTFEPQNRDIGPMTYERIFQLLLRLKANTIWPAMHHCTEGFYKIPGNMSMAKKYHIYVGTSHAEPMLRNNVSEWSTKSFGPYNYFTNSDKIKSYWQERISETKNNKNIITLGMRGIHDSGMQGDATKEQKIKLTEDIISDQRQILSQNIETPLSSIPQVLTLYKEVLYIYNNGLKVPDDITLMWTDDNYGYIRRLSNDTEKARSGGSGIYYHLSYWGRPHDYLWLSTTQPALIWYEMSRAYQNGARKIWIANVGDIKPNEYNMELFLDMTWDVNEINPNNINLHLSNWCHREFNSNKTDEIANILDEYYRLALIRRPEFMGWSQTEPQTKTQKTEFNSNGAKRRIESYLDLIDRVNRVKKDIPKQRIDAFFQLVEYPVKAAAFMNLKFLYAQQSYLSVIKSQKSSFSRLSTNAYDSISHITNVYNKRMRDGKWNNMMSMNPRNLPVFQQPTYHKTQDNSLHNEKIKSQSLSAPISISAKNFVKAKGAKGYQWHQINGLGYSNNAVTLLPLEDILFTKKIPYIQYNFEIKKPGVYNYELRFLPTHSNKFNHNVTIHIDNNLMQQSALNTKGRSNKWKQNVLRNFASVKGSIKINNTGEHAITVMVNKPGIVLDQIFISPKGYGNYYEIPPSHSSN